MSDNKNICSMLYNYNYASYVGIRLKHLHFHFYHILPSTPTHFSDLIFRFHSLLLHFLNSPLNIFSLSYQSFFQSPQRLLTVRNHIIIPFDFRPPNDENFHRFFDLNYFLFPFFFISTIIFSILSLCNCDTICMIVLYWCKSKYSLHRDLS
jgi:hypothetical protein